MSTATSLGQLLGVQPFGGRGLSGTGPKAGGPLYLGRLVTYPPRLTRFGPARTDQPARDFADWLEGKGETGAATAMHDQITRSGIGLRTELGGPVGEADIYALHPRGAVLLLPLTAAGLYHQVGAALAAGNEAVVQEAPGLKRALEGLPPRVASRLRWVTDWHHAGPFAGALIEGDAERIKRASAEIAALPGPLAPIQAPDEEGQYCPNWLLQEIVTSINTTAAGCNASLMAIE